MASDSGHAALGPVSIECGEGGMWEDIELGVFAPERTDRQARSSSLVIFTTRNGRWTTRRLQDTALGIAGSESWSR
jgi:hypothetical protein